MAHSLGHKYFIVFSSYCQFAVRIRRSMRMSILNHSWCLYIGENPENCEMGLKIRFEGSKGRPCCVPQHVENSWEENENREQRLLTANGVFFFCELAPRDESVEFFLCRWPILSCIYSRQVPRLTWEVRRENEPAASGLVKLTTCDYTFTAGLELMWPSNLDDFPFKNPP